MRGHPMIKPTIRSGAISLVALLLAACGGPGLDLEVKARLDGQPTSEAQVVVDGRAQGVTDSQGVFAKTLHRRPGAEVEVIVVKELPGYRIEPWKTSFLVRLPKDGTVGKYSFDADLQATRFMTLAATDKGAPVGDATVKVNDKEVGKTDARGEFVYEYKNLPKTGVTVTVRKTGYSTWHKTGELEPGRRLEAALSRRTLINVTAQTESAVSGQLFKYTVFREVPSAELEAEVKRLKLGIDRIATKGWQDTPLRKTVDMIVVGSVAKDDKGFVMEAKFYTSNGRLILSQVTRARDSGAITSAAREIAANVMERFPFEGAIVAVEGGSYRVNMGKPYRVGRGTELTLTAAARSEAGKVTEYRETGRLKVKRAEDAGSLAEVEDLKKGEKIKVGDRVVRRASREGEEERARSYFLLSAKGGLAPDVAPLPRVNVYLNNDWAGSTGADGKAEVPIRLGKSYALLLYRHGYQQVNEKIKLEKNGDSREFVLGVNNASFKVDSEPSSAAVFVDGDQLGKTPILEGRPVGLGFHTVKLTVGEDYRDWEEVVEFDKKIEDRTGDRKIALQRDYLKLGERAAPKGDINGAIQAYGSTDTKHPDYSEAHHRLRRIYLDG